MNPAFSLSNPWMVWVKRAMAVVLLAMAEYYLIKTGELLI